MAEKAFLVECGYACLVVLGKQWAENRPKKQGDGCEELFQLRKFDGHILKVIGL